MVSPQELALAHALLPGFAFVGPRGALGQSFEVGQPIDRITISFTRETQRDVAFPRLHFFDAAGQEIPRSEAVQHIIIAGYRKPLWERWAIGRLIRHTGIWRRLRGRQAAFESFLSGHFLRARGDQKPSLTLFLKKQAAPAHIVFECTAVGEGDIARHIQLEGYRGESCVFTHRNFSDAALVAEMRAVHAALGLAVPDLATDAARAAHCAEVLRQLCAQFEAAAPGWPPQRLLQFLPLFEPAPDLDPARFAIFAEAICALLGPRLILSTLVLQPFAAFLSKVSALEAVMAEVNRRLATRRPLPTPVIMAKHRTQQPALLIHKKQYLRALDETFPALEACGVKAVLAYGGLLGAVREKGFLPHDDDIDLIYFDGATSYDEMLERRGALREKLIEKGFRCDKEKLVNFHVKSPGSRRWLDLFPSYQKGNSLYVMVDRQAYRAMPMSIFFPASKIALYGHEFPAPADPEAFLTERYGPGWRTPDPYYEWPWPLSQD